MNDPYATIAKVLDDPSIVSRETIEKLLRYAEHLAQWQKTTNLIGAGTVDDIWGRHVLDSLQLLNHLPAQPLRIADLGSGAGLPGLILAIGAPGPGWEVSLIESNSKKVGFLRWVAADLGVQVRIVPERIEQVIELNVDVVVSRALADLPGLLGYAAPLVSNGGWCCFHKGQDVDEELTRATKYWRFEHQKRVSRVAGGGCVLTIRNLSPRPVGAA